MTEEQETPSFRSLKVARELGDELNEAIRVLRWTPTHVDPEGGLLTVRACTDHAIETLLRSLRAAYNGGRRFTKKTAVLGQAPPTDSRA